MPVPNEPGPGRPLQPPGQIAPVPGASHAPRVIPAAPPAVNGPAPNLMELMEATLAAPFSARSTFAAAGKRDCPDVGLLLQNSAAWAAMGGGALGVMAMMGVPGLSFIALGGAAAVFTLACVGLGFAGAGFLHALAMISGGSGSFDRSYQVASMSSCVLPLAAVCALAPVPGLWLLPTAVAAYLAISGVQGLHGAPDGQSWLVIGLAGAGLLAGQFAYKDDVESAKRDMENRAAIYAAGGPTIDAGNSSGASVRMPELDNPAKQYAVAPPSPGMQLGGPDYIQTPQGEDSGGSMDMIRGEGGGLEGVIPPQPTDLKAMMEGGRTPAPAEIQAMSRNMLKSVQEKLQANPAVMNALSPQDRAKIESLMRTASQYDAHIQEGKVGEGEIDPQQLLKMAQEAMKKGQPAPAPKRSKKAQ